MEGLRIKTLASDGQYVVSTVLLPEMANFMDSFLGQNPDRKPYETMIFAVDQDNLESMREECGDGVVTAEVMSAYGLVTDWTELYVKRWSTADDATKGHEHVVSVLEAGQYALPNPPRLEIEYWDDEIIEAEIVDEG